MTIGTFMGTLDNAVDYENAILVQKMFAISIILHIAVCIFVSVWCCSISVDAGSFSFSGQRTRLPRTALTFNYSESHWTPRLQLQ